MTTDSQSFLASAQVILQSASGRAIRGDTAITSENIAEFVPAPEAVARCQSAFRSAGFEIGNMVGVSFSITGTVDTFESYFQIRLRPADSGGFEAVDSNGEASRELPLGALPPALGTLIVAVTFESPAELHGSPTGWMP